MAAVSLSLCSTLLFIVVFVSAGQKEFSVKRGEDATLECYGPTDAVIRLLRWIKPDLKSDHYVFYFKEDHYIDDFQLPAFKGRVQLKDPQMKAGDFSVVLRNITMNDTGIYECCAGYGNPDDVELLSTINLKVEEPGPTGGFREDGGKEDGGEEGGSAGVAVGVAAFVMVLIAAAAAGFVIYTICKKRKDMDGRKEKGEKGDCDYGI